MLIHLILEGHLEEPVAERLLEHSGHYRGDIYGQKGFGYIMTKAHKLAPLATGGGAVLVLTDFRDSGAACPPEALNKYFPRRLSKQPPAFLLRFAEMELESWLLADREAMADFLQISPATIPVEPDKEAFPKRAIVNLAARSKNRDIKQALVPPKKHGGMVGKGYLRTMSDFVRNHWRPPEAARNSPSLERCLNRLMELGRGKSCI